MRPPETGAIVLLIALFLLFFAPVIGRFRARAFPLPFQRLLLYSAHIGAL
jgi:hypothetical protein